MMRAISNRYMSPSARQSADLEELLLKTTVASMKRSFHEVCVEERGNPPIESFVDDIRVEQQHLIVVFKDSAAFTGKDLDSFEAKIEKHLEEAGYLGVDFAFEFQEDAYFVKTTHGWINSTANNAEEKMQSLWNLVALGA